MVELPGKVPLMMREAGSGGWLSGPAASGKGCCAPESLESGGIGEKCEEGQCKKESA